MNTLQESFEEVADWCERHLEEQHGRAIGMLFGTMLRAYGRLAAMPVKPESMDNVFQRQQADKKAEDLLALLSARVIVARSRRQKLVGSVEPTSMRTNMTYDR